MSQKSRTIIVGDIHGCLNELVTLLDRVGFTPGVDHVILLGDLLDKGPQGPECVTFARKNRFTTLRGNHEDRYLRYRTHEERAQRHAGYFNPMKKLTGEDFRTYNALTPEDWYYLASAPLFLEWDDTILVHAGVKSGVTASKQNPNTLLNLGGNAWEEDHWSLTYAGPKHVVYGHTPTPSNNPRIVTKNGVMSVGLDTGCAMGGRLTAMIIPSDGDVSFESTPALRNYVAAVDRQVALRKGKNGTLHYCCRVETWYG